MPLSVKVTVPVGPPVPDTVAVNVVALLGVDVKLGFTDDVTLVVVATEDADTVKTISQLVNDTESSGKVSVM